MEHEDEDALNTVQDCEEVGHDNPLIVDVEDSNNPSWSEKNNEDNSALDPGSETQSKTHKLPIVPLIQHLKQNEIQVDHKQFPSLDACSL